MPTLLLPYKQGSASANNLASALGIRKMKLEGSKLKDRASNIILNWGNSTADLSHLNNVKIINQQDKVKLATNKLRFFQTINEFNENITVETDKIIIPEWSTSQEEAQAWIADDKDVVVRHTLQGHSGAGIQLVSAVSEENQVPTAPLYTQYTKKRDEYRVHVMSGIPFDAQRKAIHHSREGQSIVNHQIRNHQNGYTYVRQGIQVPPQVLQEAIKTVKAVGLDFGAVDVIWNQHREKAYVLEVNTACGLEGTTLQRYVAALQRKIANEEPLTLEDTIESQEENSPEGWLTPPNFDGMTAPSFAVPSRRRDGSTTSTFLDNVVRSSRYSESPQESESPRDHESPRVPRVEAVSREHSNGELVSERTFVDRVRVTNRLSERLSDFLRNPLDRVPSAHLYRLRRMNSGKTFGLNGRAFKVGGTCSLAGVQGRFIIVGRTDQGKVLIVRGKKDTSEEVNISSLLNINNYHYTAKSIWNDLKLPAGNSFIQALERAGLTVVAHRIQQFRDSSTGSTPPVHASLRISAGGGHNIQFRSPGGSLFAEITLTQFEEVMEIFND